MLRFLPFVLAALYAIAMYKFSSYRMARELDQKSTRLVDPDLTREIKKLAAAMDVQDIPVFVYHIDPINGLAAPDGRVFITKGFYEKFRAGHVSSAEMASVIAHEIGHVALGHSKRRMIDFGGQNAMRMALGALLSRFIPVIGMAIANLVANLLMAKLSRSDEFEADAYATALLQKSGIGAQAQISMFEKLDALAGGGQRPPAWLLSHPNTDTRIQAIKNNVMKWQD
jgi:putative metalloprotease